MPSYGTVDRDYGLRLATTEPADDGPVWMVNLMKYKAQAEYADGRETALTGQEADDEYTPVGPLVAVGAEIVFAGTVEDQFLGATPSWDRVGIVKYPTRRSFIEMQQRKDFQEAHEHKEAGMAETIVIGTQPLMEPLEPLRPWDEVPHPPTDDDGPYTVIHVIRFHDESGAESTPEQMESYQSGARTTASTNGVRVDGWFAAEGTILGDGRTWHQVRFNTFPSRAAFMEVVMDPARLEAQKAHRETAIADTYTLGVRASMNQLAESVGERVALKDIA